MKHKERRHSPRLSLSSGIQPQAEVRTNQNCSLPAILINLSQQGALLELNHRPFPSFRTDDQISVKFRLPHDVVWVPGIVRHCSESRLGVFFPLGMGKFMNRSTVASSKNHHSMTHRRAPQSILQAL